ncbi:Sel1 repeat protein, partial [Rhodopseudomonas sp. AAP120]
MKSLRPFSLAAAVLLFATGGASAQLSLTPPPPNPFPKPIEPEKPKPKPTPAPKAAAKPAAAPADKDKAKKPAADKGGGAKPGTPADGADAAADDPNVDLVYGAYQRGFYKTAFDLAMKRAQELGDPKAMTMLGELYANALGTKRDYNKAVEWYRRAADLGDREAMFALAMARMAGRGGGPANREEAAKWLA